MSKRYFNDYVQVINRLNMAELIDDQQQRNTIPFRASLIFNPRTGLAYDIAANRKAIDTLRS